MGLFHHHKNKHPNPNNTITATSAIPFTGTVYPMYPSPSAPSQAPAQVVTTNNQPHESRLDRLSLSATKDLLNEMINELSNDINQTHAAILSFQDHLKYIQLDNSATERDTMNVNYVVDRSRDWLLNVSNLVDYIRNGGDPDDKSRRYISNVTYDMGFIFSQIRREAKERTEKHGVSASEKNKILHWQICQPTLIALQDFQCGLENLKSALETFTSKLRVYDIQKADVLLPIRKKCCENLSDFINAMENFYSKEYNYFTPSLQNVNAFHQPSAVQNSHQPSAVQNSHQPSAILSHQDPISTQRYLRK